MTSDVPPVEVYASKEKRGGLRVVSDSDGLVAAYSAAGLAAVLDSHGTAIRWNTRSRRIESQQVPVAVDGWGPWTDRDRGAFLDWARRNWETRSGRSTKSWGPPETRLKIMVDALLSTCETDPVAEWLDALPRWDGTARIDMLLATLFTLVDPADLLAAWASRYLLLGAVQRTRTPGAKLDEIPVLIGPGGAGKSGFGRGLLPDWADDWHGDSLDLSDDHKSQAEALAGRLIVEISEMAGTRRGDLESLKAFLTRRDDGQHRGAYARSAEASPRRCVMFGTADRADALPPDRNLRRFVAVTLGPAHGAVEPWLEEHRDQLWAEAVTRHDLGERANLPRELKPSQTARNAQHRSTDMVLEDVLVEIGVHVSAGQDGHDGGIRASDLLTRVRARSGDDRITQRAVAQAAEILGWEAETRRRPESGRYWVPSPAPRLDHNTGHGEF